MGSWLGRDLCTQTLKPHPPPKHLQVLRHGAALCALPDGPPLVKAWAEPGLASPVRSPSVTILLLSRTFMCALLLVSEVLFAQGVVAYRFLVHQTLRQRPKSTPREPL